MKRALLIVVSAALSLTVANAGAQTPPPATQTETAQTETTQTETAQTRTTANPEGDHLITQYLPRARLAMQVTETLLECPAHAVPSRNRRAATPLRVARVRTASQIVAAYSADPARPFEIRVKNSFWGSRNVELTLTEDGRVLSVNMSTEGAGGAALGSLFRSIARLAALNGGVALSPQAHRAVPAPLCLRAIAERVRQAETVRQAIITTEHRVALASGDEAARLRARLEGLRAQLLVHERALTLTSAIELEPLAVEGGNEWRAFSDPPQYQRWFGNPPPNTSTSDPNDVLTDDWRAAISEHWRLRGVYGFGLVVSAEGGPFERHGRPASSEEMRIAYVQPPSASARGCYRNSAGARCLDNSPAVGEATLFLPQAAPAQMIELRSGVFVNRSLTATFAQHGAPTAIAYRSRAQLAELAAAAEGAATAAETLRDAETAELQREVAREQARVALLEARAKREALENPPPDPPSP